VVVGKEHESKAHMGNQRVGKTNEPELEEKKVTSYVTTKEMTGHKWGFSTQNELAISGCRLQVAEGRKGVGRFLQHHTSMRKFSFQKESKRE